MKKYTAILILILTTCVQVKATGPYSDPTRAATLLIYSEKAEKALNAQNRVQYLNATGHIWLEAEISEATKFQKEFNEYLDKFGDVLTMTAEVYGLYYEISKTVECVNKLENTLSNSPANSLAVAFSTRRNAVYRRIIENGVDIVEDIRTLMISKAKQTEVDKMKIFMKIRPKLHNMNKMLTVLNLTIKYTSFADVWREITDRQHSYLTGRTKKEIARQCIRNWKYNAGIR